jgi:hypothetical protein
VMKEVHELRHGQWFTLPVEGGLTLYQFQHNVYVDNALHHSEVKIVAKFWPKAGKGYWLAANGQVNDCNPYAVAELMIVTGTSVEVQME